MPVGFFSPKVNKNVANHRVLGSNPSGAELVMAGSQDHLVFNSEPLRLAMPETRNPPVELLAPCSQMGNLHRSARQSRKA